MRSVSYRKFLMPLAGALIVSCAGLDAFAQSSWSYNPYSGQSTWLWLSRGLSYPLNRLTTTSTPLYMLNPLIYNGTYAATRGFTRTPRQFGSTDPMSAANSQNGSQYGAPNATQGGQPGGVSDQITYQHRNPANQDQALLDGADAALTGAPKPDAHAPHQAVSGDPDFVPVPTQLPPVSPAATSQAPPVAPPIQRLAGNPRGRLHRKQQAPSAAAPHGGQLTASSPMSQGFIELVNSKYEGDIVKAMSDPEMRSYAKAVGIVDSDRHGISVTPERSAIIKQILADDREDPASRMNAVRLLLKH